MNRRTLAAVALVLLPAAAAAQGADAPVQITVLAEVQITRFGVTDFGPVGTGGQTYTIDPSSPTGAQQVASFTATGTPFATIIVSFAPTVELCHETAGCGTAFTFTASLIRSGGTPVNSGDAVALNGVGEHAFSLGGSVTVPASATPGLYSGMFTLSAAYP